MSKMTVRQARKTLALGTEDAKEAVKQELQAVGASNVTDVLTWDGLGNISMLASSEIPQHIQKGIKKVKVTPGQNGNSIEIEMHDKLAALRILAKHYGLMEANADADTRPSILGINLKGPEVATYEVKEDGESETGERSQPQDEPEEKED